LNANEPRIPKKIIRFELKTYRNTNINYNYIIWHRGLAFDVASRLWRSWKDELKRRGITWQDFLEILSLHTKDIVDWAIYDRIGWDELVKRIATSIDSYSRGVSSG